MRNITNELTLDQLNNVTGGDGFLDALKKAKEQLEKIDWKKVIEEPNKD